MKKLAKIAAVLLLTVLILMVLAIGVTQTSFFKSWLKSEAVAAAQPYIDGKLSVGSLQGDLFTHLELHHLVIKKADKNIVEIERLSVRYLPLLLMSKHLMVPEFIITKPIIRLVRENGNWNIDGLFKSTPGGGEIKEENPDSTFDWVLQLPSVRIQAGTICISSADSRQANRSEEIKNIRMTLALMVRDDYLQVSPGDISFEKSIRDIPPGKLTPDMTESSQDVDSTNAGIATGASTIHLDLLVKNFSKPLIHASLQAKSLSLSEVRKILIDLPVKGDLDLSLSIDGALNDLQAKLGIQHEGGSGRLRGNFNFEKTPYYYDVNGAFTDINFAKISAIQDWESDFNLSFSAKGTGTSLGGINADISVKVDSGFIRERSFNSAILVAELRGDSSSFNAEWSFADSHIDLGGYLVTGRKDTVYQFTGDFKHLNLQDVTGNPELKSDLNFDFQLDGQGIDWEDLQANFLIQSASSQIKTLHLDTLLFTGVVRDQSIEVKEFRIVSPLLHLTAGGNLGRRQAGQLTFSATFDDLSQAAGLFGLDSVAGNGIVSGKFRGTLDSLSGEATVNFEKLWMSDVKIDTFNAKLDGQFAAKRTAIKIQGNLTGADFSGIQHLMSNFSANYQDSLLNFTINLKQGDNFSAGVAGSLLVAERGYTLQVDKLGMSLFEQTWQKLPPQTEIQISGSTLNMNRLVLASDRQSISLSGSINTANRNNNDFNLKIVNFDLAQALRLIDPQSKISGQLDFESSLSGTLEAPTISGRFNLSNGSYGEHPFQTCSGQFDYHPDRFIWQFFLAETEGDSLIQCSGLFPYDFSLSPPAGTVLNKEPLEINFKTNGIDLALLSHETQAITDMGGRLAVDIRLYHTLQDLRGEGPLRLSNVSFAIPAFGIKYKDINIELELKADELLVNQFLIRSGDGDLQLIDGSLSLSKQNLDTFSVHLKAKDFEVIQMKSLQAVIDGDIQAAGNVRDIRFNGDLTVDKADVYYPAWIQEDKTVALAAGKPFFVISEDSTNFDSTGAVRFQKSLSETGSALGENDFLKNIRGKLSLTIDRNTWLRSEEATIEVEGSLEIHKQEQGVVLFGTVSTVRGYYELQGRRFQITEGKITFKGDPHINPDIQITAIYKFMDRSGATSTERQVEVAISGTKDVLQFDFTIDGQPADQKDVFAIIVFGKPFKKLTISEGNSVAQQTSLSEKAQGMLAGQLMNRLGQRIGEELNLDVLQIESGTDLGDTKVRVGKYITDDIFVDVSQDFGVGGDQEVKLEYKLPEKIVRLNLFLQALQERQGNTALDVIWKYEW